MMKPKSIATLALSMALSTPLLAEPKTGETYEIPSDLIGVSGSIGAVLEDGYRLNTTIGLAFNAEMSSETGFTALPGIWGGGATVMNAGTTSELVFGDSGFSAKLKIPPNTLTSDFVIFISMNPMNKPMNVRPETIQAANANLAKTLTKYTKPLNDQLWEFVVLDGNGNRFNSNFQANAILTLPYKDDDDDGIVDGTQPPLRAENLSVWWLDETHSLWVKLPDATVDRTAKTVSAPIRHFSVYAIMGAPSFVVGDAFAFPVPWRPNGSKAGTGADQTGTLAGGITFSNLPSTAKIRVYSLSGQLVRELGHDDGTPQKTWDVKSDSGDEVASGTYIYVIESNSSRKTGKLVVLR